MQSFVDRMHEHWPAVIAFDTWLTVGAKENDPTAMTEAVSMLAHVREVFGLDGSSLVVHHTGHSDDGRPRGASTFLGAFDTLIRVEPGLVQNTKQKDNDEFADIPFTVEKFASSVAIVKTGAMSAAIHKASERERHHRSCK